MNSTLNGDFLTVMQPVSSTQSTALPSTIMLTAPLPSVLVIVSTESSLYTTGRECSECAQIGVIMKASMSGVRTDPPAAREYAVETSIQKDENAVVFKNYPLSSITIMKQDESENPLEGAEFTLEQWNTESEEWKPYGEKATSGADGKGYFQNLHAGDYRITEIKTKAGYVLLKEPIEITLPYEYKAGSIVNGTKVTSDGTAYDITFTIVNGQAFDLPASGLRGIGPIAAAGIAIVVIAGAVFAARNIKGQRAASNRRKRRPH